MEKLRLNIYWLPVMLALGFVIGNWAHPDTVYKTQEVAMPSGEVKNCVILRGGRFYARMAWDGFKATCEIPGETITY